MEGPFVDSPITEEARHDAVGPVVLQRQRQARGDGDTAADDGDGRQDPDVRVTEVHRASATAEAPGLATVDLGHGHRGVHALGERVAVGTVCGGDPVGVPQGGAHAHGDCLLTLRLMQGARDLALQEPQVRSLLEVADDDHSLQQRERCLFSHPREGPPGVTAFHGLVLGL